MKTRSTKKLMNGRRKPRRLDLAAYVEQRTHDLWLADGYRHGTALDHWLLAEFELLGFKVARAGAR